MESISWLSLALCVCRWYGPSVRTRVDTIVDCCLSRACSCSVGKEEDSGENQRSTDDTKNCTLLSGIDHVLTKLVASLWRDRASRRGRMPNFFLSFFLRHGWSASSSSLSWTLPGIVRVKDNCPWATHRIDRVRDLCVCGLSTCFVCLWLDDMSSEAARHHCWGGGGGGSSLFLFHCCLFPFYWIWLDGLRLNFTGRNDRSWSRVCANWKFDRLWPIRALCDSLNIRALQTVWNSRALQPVTRRRCVWQLEYKSFAACNLSEVCVTTGIRELCSL